MILKNLFFHWISSSHIFLIHWKCFGNMYKLFIISNNRYEFFSQIFITKIFDHSRCTPYFLTLFIFWSFRFLFFFILILCFKFSSANFIKFLKTSFSLHFSNFSDYCGLWCGFFHILRYSEGFFFGFNSFTGWENFLWLICFLHLYFLCDVLSLNFWSFQLLFQIWSMIFPNRFLEFCYT